MVFLPGAFLMVVATWMLVGNIRRVKFATRGGNNVYKGTLGTFVLPAYGRLSVSGADSEMSERGAGCNTRYTAGTLFVCT